MFFLSNDYKSNLEFKLWEYLDKANKMEHSVYPPVVGVAAVVVVVVVVDADAAEKNYQNNTEFRTR